MNGHHELEAALEAILFASSEPVPRQRLLELFGDREAEAALEAVLARYRRGDGEGRGIMLDEAAGGLRLVTRPELGGYLRRFFEVAAPPRMSMPALETLTIIAYRQPVTAPEIQGLRGVDSSAVLKTLLEKRWIRIVGRKRVVGRPFLYATTRVFLLQFGLASLDELPPLEQFEEMMAENVELVPEESSAEAPPLEANEEPASAADEGGRTVLALPAPTVPHAGETERVERQPRLSWWRRLWRWLKWLLGMGARTRNQT